MGYASLKQGKVIVNNPSLEMHRRLKFSHNWKVELEMPYLVINIVIYEYFNETC